MAASTRRWDTVKLLVWKNWTLQKRRPIGTCCEIGIPTFFALVLLALRFLIDSKDIDIKVYPSVPLTATDPYWATNPKQNFLSVNDEVYDTIAYYPASDPNVAAVMNSVESSLLETLPSDASFSMISLQSSRDIDAILSNGTKLFAAVGFRDTGLPNPNSTGALDLGYVLRMPTDIPSTTQDEDWMTEWNFPIWDAISPRNWDRIPYFSPRSSGNDADLESSIPNGFLQIQAAIDQSLAKYYTNSQLWPQMTPRVTSYPFPAYEDDGFVNILSGFLPFLLVLSFLYTVMSITRALIAEKETRMKEAMRMMGLPNWVNWAAWFIKDVSFLLVSVIIMTILFHAGGVMKNSDSVLVFLLLLLFSLTVITFSYMMSTMFSTSNVGAIVALFLWFMLYQPYAIVAPNYDDLTTSDKNAMCILAPTCIGMATRVVAQFESRGVGVQFDNLYESPAERDNFYMGSILWWLLFDSVFYFLVCIYIENVFPGRYGVPKGAFFFLQRGYWFGHIDKRDQRVEAVDPQRGTTNKNFQNDFEPVPPNKSMGISMQNVRKAFDTPAGTKVAVNDVNLDVLEDTITVLLGHNGAGKTTSMNMMVGMVPPTSGKVLVNGWDMATQTQEARESLGMCPQFDILFPNLTVREHMYFFSRLKGAQARNTIARDCETFLQDVDLVDKASVRSKHLSGGQKRALSVALGFIGGSKTVILDEPTSGMDPMKRRHTWDLISKHRQGRTILLTTHFLDEADLLGDRIAIMHQGIVRCMGSSLFLKQRFGCGYHMIVQKTQNNRTDEIKSVVESHIRNAGLEQDLGQSMVFQLPKDSSSSFPGLFAELESRQSELGIESCGASVTTMEDVFLKLNSSAETRIKDSGVDELDPPAETSILMDESSGSEASYVPLRGSSLLLIQLYAMLVKRFKTLTRHRRLLFAQTVTPLIIVCIAIVIAKYATERVESVESCRSFNTGDFDSSTSYTAAQNTWGFNGGASLIAASTSSQITSLLSSTEQFIDTSPLTSTMSFVEVENVTSSILEGAQDFRRTEYYRRHPASFAFGPGAIWINSQCEVRVNDQYRNAPLALLSGTTYVFYYFPLDSSDSSDSLRGISWTSPSGTLSEQIASPNHSVAITVSYSASDDSGLGSLNCTSQNGSVYSVDLNFTSDETAAFKTTGVFGEALFNRQMYHSAPEALNFFGNIVIRHLTGNSQVSIPVSNCPLPKSNEKLADDEQSNGSFTFGLGINLALGLSLFLASATLFPVDERATLAKHIQYVSGAQSTVYWLGNFISDYLVGLVPALGIVVLFAAFKVEEFENILGEVFLCMLLYLWAALPCIYCFSFLFSKSSNAYAICAALFWIMSLSMIMVIYFLPLFNNREYVKNGLVANLKYGFYINPVYAAVQAVLDMYDNYRWLKFCIGREFYCDAEAIEPQANYLSMKGNGIGIPLLFLFVEGIVYSCLLYLIDTDSLKWSRNRANVSETSPNEDDDVVAERERLADPRQRNNDRVTCHQLHKTYSNNKVAVKTVSFGVGPGEIFGLLGVNGAGKSTTFKMLTGEVSIGGGTAAIDDFDVKTQLSDARRHLGYCPQYDGLITYLTGRELLTLFARLRGIPKDQIDEAVTKSIASFGLGQHCDRYAGSYSGGNKRKLSAAIAFIGSPKVVFLDEPTTGMDPEARRLVWDSLHKSAKMGTSIVLTSHSMEECEALCTKVGILVSGEFKCYGSTQHIKSKFAQGYLLIAKLNDKVSSTSFVAFLESKLGSILVQGQHENQLDISIGGNVKLSSLFALFEADETQEFLLDYSLSQTSLEQVFLSFAKVRHITDL